MSEIIDQDILKEEYELAKIQAKIFQLRAKKVKQEAKKKKAERQKEKEKERKWQEKFEELVRPILRVDDNITDKKKVLYEINYMINELQFFEVINIDIPCDNCDGKKYCEARSCDCGDCYISFGKYDFTEEELDEYLEYEICDCEF